MHLEIEIPATVPVMTLPRTVFFPHAILPLHIFEMRYRRMLADVLQANQLFAVACRVDSSEGKEERPAPVATVGIVRASQQNPDGTSNLVLQGLYRVKVRSFTTVDPYPIIAVEPLHPQGDDCAPELGILKAEICSLLESEADLTNGVPAEFLAFLHDLDDPGTFVDLIAFATCRSPKVKQTLLETLDVPARFRLFARYLERERERLRLHRALQGDLSENSIPLN